MNHQQRSPLSAQPFTTQLRVRHYEMDTLGHVNNAVYLHYLEQAAIEHSEHLGLTVERYQALKGIFVLRRMAIDYHRAAVAGDRLEITTWVQEMRGPRATRGYEIHRQETKERLVSAEAQWVWVDAATRRPRAIPKVLLTGFLGDETDRPTNVGPVGPASSNKS